MPGEPKSKWLLLAAVDFGLLGARRAENCMSPAGKYGQMRGVTLP